jgi:hypothetical protein
MVRITILPPRNHRTFSPPNMSDLQNAVQKRDVGEVAKLLKQKMDQETIKASLKALMPYQSGDDVKMNDKITILTTLCGKIGGIQDDVRFGDELLSQVVEFSPQADLVKALRTQIPQLRVPDELEEI